MKLKIAALAFAAVAAVTVVAHAATVAIQNQDSRSYRILISTDDHCFAGLHTSISGNTSTTIDVGYLCLEEQKPAFKLETGKSYIIKDGKVSAK